MVSSEAEVCPLTTPSKSKMVHQLFMERGYEKWEMYCIYRRAEKRGDETKSAQMRDGSGKEIGCRKNVNAEKRRA